MTDHKNILKDFVKQFKKWLSKHHSPQEILDLHFDDTSYPDWRTIEHYFSNLVLTKQIDQLDKEDLSNLIYLIARSWDIGRMIAWLSHAPAFSNICDLSKADFLILARAASQLPGAEYDDAKSQFATCFKNKFDAIDPEIETMLLDLYHGSGEYTKRISLVALAKFGYSAIRDLLKQSWNTVDEEYHKIGCLEAISEYIKDPELLDEYLTLAATEKGEQLEKYVVYLRDQKGN